MATNPGGPLPFTPHANGAGVFAFGDGHAEAVSYKQWALMAATAKSTFYK